MAQEQAGTAMLDPLLRFLAPLQRTLAGPGVTGLEDRALRKQLETTRRVLAWLTTAHAVQPALEAAALRAFVETAAEASDLIRSRGLTGHAVQRVVALGERTAPPTRDELLAPVRDLQHQLCFIADDHARALRRRLVEIETRLSIDLAAAFERQLALPPESAEGGGAANTRRIDEARFNAFLARAFPAEPGLRLAQYTYIAGGHSKYTAKVQLAGAKSVPGSMILRGDGSGKYGGRSVTGEYRLLEVLHRNGVSVPRPLALEESGEVFGAPIMLVEEMPGQTVGHMFDLPPPNAAVSGDVAVQLARIHRIPLAEFQAAPIGAERSNREQALQWLNESYASFKALDRASVLYETAFHWLRENIALVDGPRCLVHGDCGLNNLMIHEDRVGAILDWEFAFAGNPFYDLGYFFFQAEHLGGWDTFLQAYRDAGGREPTPAQLDYQILFATTRLGVMVMQTEAAFAAGVLTSLGGAVACTGYHDVSVMRIARILERVL